MSARVLDEAHNAECQLEKARCRWNSRERIESSLAEIYLRQSKGYGAAFPATLNFLPSSKHEHYPALIAAFGMASEIEPGVMSLENDHVQAVHLTLLKPDRSGKVVTGGGKIIIGHSLGFPIVLAPMNDLLGLIICEGIETGLSLYEATGCGVWAAGSAGRMPAIADKVPSYTNCVTVVVESGEAGRKGALELAFRLDARGLHQELRFLSDEEASAA